MTIATALIGYPLSYWISRLAQRSQLVAIGLVTMTFWVSILVRTYAWIVPGNGGILNRWLQSLGIVSRPVEFLYNEGGVAVGMINVLLPFLVLPLYAAMRRRSPLIHVAETLELLGFKSSGGCFFRSLQRRLVLVWCWYLSSAWASTSPGHIGRWPRAAHRQHDGPADQQVCALGDGGRQLGHSAHRDTCLL